MRNKKHNDEGKDTSHKRDASFFGRQDVDRERKRGLKGCGGKNVKEIEKNMRRRPEGEETARLALTLTPPTACK